MKRFDAKYTKKKAEALIYVNGYIKDKEISIDIYR